jgi:putative transposase
MPFKASFRHQYWSVDVRYIEEHCIPEIKGPVYLITILENYSRAVLASKVSPTQNQWDYLEVLFAALRTAGVPKAIVSDGGGIFYCNQALEVYKALGIQKERIHPKQAWENYVETMFNVVRRMADAKFADATSWREMQETHRTWVCDYNVQRHWAHRERQDGCMSPAQVLGWHKGTMYPETVLNRILFATRYTRTLDKHGYLCFHRWKLYAERGLAKEPVTIWVYDGTLKVEYQATLLSQYTVQLQEDRRHIKQVSRPSLVDTPFRSAQWTLFDLGPDDWLLYLRLPDYAIRRRKRQAKGIVQLGLFENALLQQAVGTGPLRSQLRLVPIQAEE